MKFYETSFDDYIKNVQKFNLHPELTDVWNRLPRKLSDFPNMIFYGPAGVGKYSQLLYCIQRYSNNRLKMDKKISAQLNKQTYIYHISDIHYEVDMGLLGCNSKLLWHEIFTQIVDIISVKQDKVGIIVCKNFHNCHNELLEIFYSYMQQYNSALYSNILIKFILVSEHLGFIPNTILNTCYKMRIARPSAALYHDLLRICYNVPHEIACGDLPRVEDISNIKEYISQKMAMAGITPTYDTSLLRDEYFIPEKSFHIICDNIIRQILDHKKLSFATFRDSIYDIFIYNLDVTECVWYITTEIIRNPKVAICAESIARIMSKSYSFLQYFNNNYRPIYHLESFFIYIIIQISGGAEYNG